MDPQAGPSVVRLTGSEPGVLDESQRSRLLRSTNSTLSFASFDPHVATPHEISDFSRISLNEERCRPKRIVIETIPGHGSFWRWIPSARKQQGVNGDGEFPRLIEVCGQLCECSQDQWDIYKLDPLYDCYVKFPPALTVISVKETVSYEPTSPHPRLNSEATKDDEYDSERMLVDDDNPAHMRNRTRFRKRKQSPREPLLFNFSSIPPPSPEEPKEKRRAHVSFQTLDPEEEENAYLEEDSRRRNTKLYAPKNQKRARTLSPDSQKRAASAATNAQRARHENMKQARRREEMEARRDQRERHFLREVLSEVPQGSAHFNGNGMHDIPEEPPMAEPYENVPNGDQPNGTHHYEEEEEDPTPNHRYEEEEEEDPIAASRRKMAELNADRDKQRVRESQLRDDEEAGLKAKEERLRTEAEKRRLAELEKQRVQEEARLREEHEQTLKREEQRRRRAEFLDRLERERATRHDQWNSGTWTHSRAIERYKLACAFFDKARFSQETLPLTFIDIPWPTLQHPSLNRPQDTDWQSTNDFFHAIQPSLRGQSYKDFLKQSFQRFHPDRWSSRNLFSAIIDEDERNEIDTAVSTVSKAIGALYTDARGA